MISENDTKQQSIGVDTYSFTGLTEHSHPSLELDSYQRPYVWTQEKVEQLIEDLIEYQNPKKEKKADQPDYYMGTLLLHQKDKKLFVIDGQQRLTTLCILYYTLKKKLPNNFNFHFRSAVSSQHIKKAQETCQAYRPQSGVKQLNLDIFEHIHFTTITVEREDLAFTFFDTQNNRGVPLAATDLLKAHHLRAITDTPLRWQCAERWENLQQAGVNNSGQGNYDFAPVLFDKFLWRARSWKGQNRHLGWEDHDALLHAFQKQAISKSEDEQDSTIPLYPSLNNRLAAKLTLSKHGDKSLTLSTSGMNSTPESLPFSLRHPIHKGLGFFLYTHKYAALHEQLFHKNNEPEVLAFRKLRQTASFESEYLLELFDLATLFYVDQFQYKKLLEFALWLEYVLGAIRFDLFAIRWYKPMNYLAYDADFNLLDVIAGAYRPEEVIEFLKSDQYSRDVYSSSEKFKDIERRKQKRGWYLDAILRYYGYETGKPSFENRKSWITKEFIEKKIEEAKYANC